MSDPGRPRKGAASKFSIDRDRFPDRELLLDQRLENGHLPDVAVNAHNVASSTLYRQANELISGSGVGPAKQAKALELVGTGYREYTSALVSAYPSAGSGSVKKMKQHQWAGRRFGKKWLPKGERAKNVKFKGTCGYRRSRKCPSFSPKDVKHSLTAIVKEIIYLLKCELGILTRRGHGSSIPRTEKELRRRAVEVGEAWNYRRREAFHEAVAAATKEKEERARAEQQASRAARAAARGRPS